MKKIFFVLLTILLFSGLANAQSIVWYNKTTATMAWDSVPKVATTDNDNQYQVLWRTDLVSAGTNVGSPITATQLALTIPVDVKYYFGVKALRFVGGAKVTEITVAWSSDPVSTANAPWGFDTIRSPQMPTNIRLLP
jgi:hypothetical protein